MRAMHDERTYLVVATQRLDDYRIIPGDVALLPCRLITDSRAQVLHLRLRGRLQLLAPNACIVHNASGIKRALGIRGPSHWCMVGME